MSTRKKEFKVGDKVIVKKWFYNDGSDNAHEWSGREFVLIKSDDKRFDFELSDDGPYVSFKDGDVLELVRDKKITQQTVRFILRYVKDGHRELEEFYSMGEVTSRIKEMKGGYVSNSMFVYAVDSKWAIETETRIIKKIIS